MKRNSTSKLVQSKALLRIAILTGLILMVPLIAMQFTEAVAWDLPDFVIGGGLLFTTGILLWLITSKISNLAYRRAAAAVLVLALLLTWMDLAVDIF